VRSKGLLVAWALVVIGFTVAPAAGAVPDGDLTSDQLLQSILSAEPASPQAPPEAIFPDDQKPILRSCSATAYCYYAAPKTCSCGGGGSCDSYPSGNPYGGYVTCACAGGGTTTLTCPPPPPPVCNKKACDLSCGGPGYGFCTQQGQCVCL